MDLRSCRFGIFDVGECIFQENVSVATFNIPFESSQNKPHYGTKITNTEEE